MKNTKLFILGSVLLCSMLYIEAADPAAGCRFGLGATGLGDSCRPRAIIPSMGQLPDGRWKCWMMYMPGRDRALIPALLNTQRANEGWIINLRRMLNSPFVPQEQLRREASSDTLKRIHRDLIVPEGAIIEDLLGVLAQKINTQAGKMIVTPQDFSVHIWQYPTDKEDDQQPPWKRLEDIKLQEKVKAASRRKTVSYLYLVFKVFGHKEDVIARRIRGEEVIERPRFEGGAVGRDDQRIMVAVAPQRPLYGDLGLAMPTVYHHDGYRFGILSNRKLGDSQSPAGAFPWVYALPDGALQVYVLNNDIDLPKICMDTPEENMQWIRRMFAAVLATTTDASIRKDAENSILQRIQKDILLSSAEAASPKASIIGALVRKINTRHQKQIVTADDIVLFVSRYKDDQCEEVPADHEFVEYFSRPQQCLCGHPCSTHYAVLVFCFKNEDAIMQRIRTPAPEVVRVPLADEAPVAEVDVPDIHGQMVNEDAVEETV